MSRQLQGLIEPVPEYNMSLITENFGVKLTEDIANQNASGRCKCKKIWTRQLMHRAPFSPSDALCCY